MSALLLFMPVITLDGARKLKKKEGGRRVQHSCDLFSVLKLENGAIGSFAYGENKCGDEAERWSANDCQGDEVLDRVARLESGLRPLSNGLCSFFSSPRVSSSRVPPSPCSDISEIPKVLRQTKNLSAGCSSAFPFHNSPPGFLDSLDSPDPGLGCL